MILYHGSNILFLSFSLDHVAEGTGTKFGFGIYLTESESSAVHYSQPRNQPISADHYLYTVEIPDITMGNHLMSALPVSPDIVQRVQDTLGHIIPPEYLTKGKECRKWIGCTLTGAKKAGSEEEKAASEFLRKIGVLYNVWPTAQTKPDGLKNVCVYCPSDIRILKVEHVEIYRKNGKNLLVDGSRREVEI